MGFSPVEECLTIWALARHVIPHLLAPGHTAFQSMILVFWRLGNLDIEELRVDVDASAVHAWLHDAHAIAWATRGSTRGAAAAACASVMPMASSTVTTMS